MRGELHPTRDREAAGAGGRSAGRTGTPDGPPEGQVPDAPALGPTGRAHPAQHCVRGAVHPGRDRRAVLPGPEVRRAEPDLGPAQARQRRCGWPRAAGLEVLSVVSYAVLFRTVFARGFPRLSWRASIEIPLAGIAAIRLLAAAGAGGVAVTVWALRRAGMAPRLIACRMAANYSIQYSLYLLALIVCGLGLYAGVFAGEGPVALTLLPAIFSAVALGLGAAMGLVPGDFERRLERSVASLGPDRAAGHALRHAAGDARVGRPHCARAGPRAAPGTARGGRLLGLRHRGSGRVVQGVRRDGAGGGADDGLLPRDAREPAAAAGRHRRRRGRDDRRVRRVRRVRRPRRGRGAGLPRDFVLAAHAARRRRVRDAALDRPELAARRPRAARGRRERTERPVSSRRGEGGAVERATVGLLRALFGATRWTGRRARGEVVKRVGGPARTRVVVMFGAVLALNGADSATVGAVAPQLESALHIGNAKVGLLASVSLLVGAVFTIPVGLLVDRSKRMPMLSASIVLWSVASLFSAFAGSYGTLLLTRLLLGAVAATAGPAIASLTGDYFPARERGQIYAYILGGEIAGTAFGFIISSSVASLIDWRAAFVLLAIPGFFLARELWRTVPEPLRGGQSRLEPGWWTCTRRRRRRHPTANGSGSTPAQTPRPRTTSRTRRRGSGGSSRIQTSC